MYNAVRFMYNALRFIYIALRNRVFSAMKKFLSVVLCSSY